MTNTIKMRLVKSKFKSHYFFFFIFFALLQYSSVNVYAQVNNDDTYLIGDKVFKANELINTDQFVTELLEAMVLDKINQILDDRDRDLLITNELMKKVAIDQAQYMAQLGDDTKEQKNKHKANTGLRMQFYGGSAICDELIAKANVSKGKEAFSYVKIADDVVFRWMTNAKTSALLESGNYQYIGIASRLDLAGRKVFISAVLGNYKSFNEGAKNRDLLTHPYTTKTFGLEGYDPVVCKKIDRLNYLNELQDALVVEGREVFIESNNIKTLQRIFRNNHDGLALDILQPDQYVCQYPNIIDYNLVNRGIMTKRVFTSKLFKKNLANDPENPKAFRTQIATLPQGIDTTCELNLLIIQDKKVCKSISESFVIPTTGTYTRNVRLLADTVTINSHFVYKPVPDTMQLSFKIPFENKKYSYNTDDIEPFLRLLNEPAFTILELKITAYSSVEGNNQENRELQQKRAESIINALKSRQASGIKTEIITDYNWDDFARDIRLTKHNIMASMSIEQAQNYIKQFKLSKELEPMLDQHRYARIEMKVTYNIDGENEWPYVVKKFNQAVATDDRPMALSIEKYIMKKVLKKEYKPDVLNQLQISESPSYAGIAMNKYWLMYKTHILDESSLAKNIEQLAKINPANEYIVFNYLLMQLNNPADLFKNIGTGLQIQIDRLYYTSLQKETVDGLNIKLQFKMIDEVDSLSHSKSLKNASIEKIKQIVNIKEESLENSLKLAELFIENKDYQLAIKALEPWITETTDNERVLFTYVSLCSLFEQRMHTSVFNLAMSRAQKTNPNRYCAMFNGDGFSLRVLENDKIKTDYCKFCNSDRDMAIHE
jgi:hypothetical protein